MSTKITKLDRKLLYELDKNGRQSLNALSKITEVSRERVHYRIKRFEQLGIIKGYRTIINVSGLGYLSFRLLVRLQNATPADQQKILDYLNSCPELGWLVSVEGRWDINTWIRVKNLHEYNEFHRAFESKFKHFIAKTELGIYYRITQHTKAFLVGKDHNDDPTQAFIGPSSLIAYDDTDEIILRILAENARIPLLELANKIGMSSRQTQHRIKSLEQKKAILGYRAIVDLEKLGYTYYKLLISLSNWSNKAKRGLLSYLKQHPNLIFTDEIINGFDIELEFMTNGKQHMRNIINDLRTRFADAISSYELQEYAKEYKYLFFPEDSS